MGNQEEQERRRDLLLRALETCPDPEQALTMAARMEQFITSGHAAGSQPVQAMPNGGALVSEPAVKKCNRVRWTEDDDTHLRDLWQSNLTVEEIAQELQRTPASIYARVRILDLSAEDDETKNGKRKKKRTSAAKRALTVASQRNDELEAVGIESVVHFLRTRDYSVVQTDDDCFDVDGRKILTAQELFERANGVRAQLGRPTWAALSSIPNIDETKKTEPRTGRAAGASH